MRGDADLHMYSCCISLEQCGALHGKLEPSTQVASMEGTLKHTTTAGHEEVSVLFFCDTCTEDHGD